jgi:hypothetical protein
MARHVRVPEGAVTIYAQRPGHHRPEFRGYHFPHEPVFYLRNDHDGSISHCAKRDLLGEMVLDAELVARLAAAQGWSLDEAREWLRVLIETAASTERAIAEAALSFSPSSSGPRGPDLTETADADPSTGPILDR